MYKVFIICYDICQGIKLVSSLLFSFRSSHSHSQAVRLICLLVHGLVFSCGLSINRCKEMIYLNALLILFKVFGLILGIMRFLIEFHTFGIRSSNSSQVLLIFNCFYS